MACVLIIIFIMVGVNQIRLRLALKHHIWIWILGMIIKREWSKFENVNALTVVHFCVRLAETHGHSVTRRVL